MYLKRKYVMKSKYVPIQLHFDFGVTQEQACIMCHLSANCEMCCVKCQAQGKECSNAMQACSQVDLDKQGARWDTWMYNVAVHFPELKKYIPKKYKQQVDMALQKHNIIMNKYK